MLRSVSELSSNLALASSKSCHDSTALGQSFSLWVIVSFGSGQLTHLGSFSSPNLHSLLFTNMSPWMVLNKIFLCLVLVSLFVRLVHARTSPGSRVGHSL